MSAGRQKFIVAVLIRIVSQKEMRAMQAQLTIDSRLDTIWRESCPCDSQTSNDNANTPLLTFEGECGSGKCQGEVNTYLLKRRT
jgi:hypothetical protein